MQNSKLKILRLVRIWLMIASRAIQSQLSTSWAAILFLLGKIIRFLMFFIFVFSVLSKTPSLVGYSKSQVILFYLVFNLVDISVQSLYRGVYLFRRQVISGSFDLELLRPLPSFFRPIFGWTDIFDILTLIPLWIYFFYFVVSENIPFTALSLVNFFILFINSLVFSFSIHLIICGVCVLTTEIDHLIWVYRDLANTARFPTDIYSKGFRFFLTFFVPVVVIFTVPTKVLMSLVSWPVLLLVMLVTFVFLTLSFKFWQYAIKNYSSASS